MVAIKPQQAASFLRSIPKEIEAILVHGTDPGLVAERARTAAESLAARDTPPGEIIRIEDVDLESDPERLAVELRTLPMFGGRQIVRTTLSRRITAQALKSLVEPGSLSGYLIVEGGNLRPDDAARQLFERGPNTAALACYADEARDIDALISETMREAHIEITEDARQLLATRLGADRAMTRSELEKLTLFAYGRKRIEIEDVDAVVGDAAELALDLVINAAAAGRAGRALSLIDRAVAAGESPQGIILALQRYVQRLDRVRANLDGGSSFEDAVRSLRPPLHFKQKAAFESQVRVWDRARLAHLHTVVDKAARAARRTSALEETLLEHMVLDMARLAPSPAQSRR